MLSVSFMIVGSHGEFGFNFLERHFSLNKEDNLKVELATEVESPRATRKRLS